MEKGNDNRRGDEELKKMKQRKKNFFEFAKVVNEKIKEVYIRIYFYEQLQKFYKVDDNETNEILWEDFESLVKIYKKIYFGYVDDFRKENFARILEKIDKSLGIVSNLVFNNVSSDLRVKTCSILLNDLQNILNIVCDLKRDGFADIEIGEIEEIFDICCKFFLNRKITNGEIKELKKKICEHPIQEKLKISFQFNEFWKIAKITSEENKDFLEKKIKKLYSII